MVVEVLLGVVVADYALRTLARDRGVRDKLQQWSEKAGEKAKQCKV